MNTGWAVHRSELVTQVEGLILRSLNSVASSVSVHNLCNSFGKPLCELGACAFGSLEILQTCVSRSNVSEFFVCVQWVCLHDGRIEDMQYLILVTARFSKLVHWKG
jgi:hypothetical protein